MFTRRRFLGSVAAGAAVAALARPARAAGVDGPRFLFVHAVGGWDPLCVFAPLFGAEGIDMEADAEPLTLGDLRIVDHPGRPSVRSFFERWGHSTVILNGVSTRSVNHETCQAVAMTGSTSDSGTDWATRLADARRGDFRLPHVVVSGPAFPGDRTVIVSRAQGRLQSVVDGRVLADADRSLTGARFAGASVVDRYLARRAFGFVRAEQNRPRRGQYAEALSRAQGLVSDRLQVVLESGSTLEARLETAVSALATGVCRCASVGTDVIFDTHTDNSLQIGLFEGFFSALAGAMRKLESTPGPGGAPLAGDTIVVVGSEMGRTPAYNATVGRDHWPFTSMLLIGPGLTGGRVVGGFTPRYGGVGVVPASGALDPALPGITADQVGATLLQLGGLDSRQLLPFAAPIEGILA